ncbi:MAG: hypothetical protein D6766_01800 [Verrucomicrobia bacterium]|nr:MAG: hypothetical protein D6766_01800 [Verrucomicrobiota bacterium]
MTPHPFDRPMQINMVTETYDWMPAPSEEELANDAINATYYDWVRVWVLVPEDAPPRRPGIVWKDQLPASAASTILDPLATEAGVPDPLGGDQPASRVFYADTSHPEYRNLSLNSGMHGLDVSMMETRVRVPLGGGFQYANLDEGYKNRPYRFEVEVYVPPSSPLGRDANDAVSLLIRWQNARGEIVQTDYGPAARLGEHGGWQTLSMEGLSPVHPAVVRVAPILSTRDAGQNCPAGETLYYLRNLSFELLGPPLPPRLHYQIVNARLVLDWDDPLFKLQYLPLEELGASPLAWRDYPMGENPHPPVAVPLAGTGRLFRLAPR